MNVLIDVVHPAHVHFYRHIRSDLLEAGHEVEVVARDKDVTRRLLDAFDIPHLSIGRAGRKGSLRQAIELATRDINLHRIARRFEPDVILTRNPAGVQVARAVGAKGVFDTDDGRAAGVHFWAAVPFAHVVTTPTCDPASYGRRHRKYPGYKALAYLHPDRFRPDPSIRTRLGLQPDEPYSIVRFVAFNASHDRSAQGLGFETKLAIVRELQRMGRVFISTEDRLPEELEAFAYEIPPELLHDALASAAVYIGDSQTMVVEASLLGVPALHCSSWSGRLPYLVDLEKRYGLIRSMTPARQDELLLELRSIQADLEGAQQKQERRRDTMLADMVDVTTWYVDLTTELGLL